MIQIPQIRIQTTPTKIGMDSKQAKLMIEQPKAKVDIRQEFSKVEISHSNAEILIDQSRAFKAYGVYSPLELTKNISEQSKQEASKAVAKIVETGNRLAAIQNKQNPIPDIARENMFNYPQINVLGEASRLNVDINVKPGKLDMKWHGGKAHINITPQYPKFNYVPGNLDIYVKQYPTLKIDFTNINKKV